MRIDDLRTDLHKAIDAIDDEALLSEIQHLIALSADQKEEAWDELPEAVKSAIEEGLLQSERGQTLTNEQVKQKLNNWFSS